MQNAARRIVIPLDVSSSQEALALVHALRGRVGLFKVGLELFCSAGPSVVDRIVALGEEVFLDLKLHDIPNTVARAAAAAAGLGVAMMDVHLSGGERMIAAASAALRDAAAGRSRRPLLLGITVLTSLDRQDLDSVGVRASVAEQVVALATLGRRAGLDGVVASPHEIAAIKQACGPDFLVVTPGIRPAGADATDQKRVMTPAQALEAGADYLVIGRPITGAPDPSAALEQILSGLPS